MSTRPLYPGFGIKGYLHKRSEFVGCEIHLTVEHPSDHPRCVACRSRRVTLLGGRQRRFRALPIGRRAVWILLQFPRLECKACGAVRQAEVSFAPERHGYRKRFGRYAAELARHMTIRVPMLVVGLSLGGMQGVAVAVVRSKLGGRMVGRYFLRRLIHVSELDVIRTVGPAAIGAGLVLAGGWLIHTVIGGPETVPGLALVGALVFVPPAAITYRELKPELAALGGQIRPRAAP